MSISKKSLLALAAILLLIVSTACSSQEAQSGNTVKVAYRDFGASGKALTEWLNVVKAEFEQQHPGAKVQLVPVQASEADWFAKIALMMKSEDTAPDVVTEDTFMVNSDAKAGYLEPLDDKVKGWSDWENFYDGVKNGVTANDGKIYGVPYSTDTRGLFYNVNIFKKAGLPVPWQPKNWNDILTAAQTIKKKVPGVVPFWANSGKASGEATSMQTFEMLLYGTNDTLYDSKSGKWIVKSPGFLNSLKFIQTIYSKGLGPQLSQVLTGQAGDILVTQLMPKEKVGIVLNGNWIPSAWRKDGPTPWPEGTKVYQFTAMPTQNGQTPGFTSMSGGWALSIPSKAKDKELAWEFIKLATSKKHLKEYSLKTGDLTTRKDVANDPEYKAEGIFNQATKFLEFTHFRPAVDQYPAVSTQIQTTVEAVVTGSLTPKQAMDQYAQNVSRVVGTDKVVSK